MPISFRSGAIHCQDVSVCWILYNLTQEQINEGVNSSYSEDSGLRLITVDTRGYEAPLTNFGADAVDKWFSPAEVQEMLELTSRLVI